MAYTTLDPNKIKVGDPNVKELWDLIKDNLDDHETRIDNFEAGAVKIPIFIFEVTMDTFDPDLTGLAYFTAIQGMTISEAYIQIFEKNSLTGSLEIDIKKSTTDLANASFTTIFTTKPKIVYAAAANYDQSTNQVIDSGSATLNVGDVLRLDLTILPSQVGGSGQQIDGIRKFLIVCYGEL